VGGLGRTYDLLHDKMPDPIDMPWGCLVSLTDVECASILLDQSLTT